MSFHQQLTERRKTKQLSQEQLAEQLHVSRQAVSKWETGETRPDMEKLIALSEALDISLDALCKGEQRKEETVWQQTAEAGRKKKGWIAATGLLLLCAAAALGYWVGARQTAFPSQESVPSVSIASLQHTLLPNDGAPLLKMIVVPDQYAADMGMEVLCIDEQGSIQRIPATGVEGSYQVMIPLSTGIPYTIDAQFKQGDEHRIQPLLKVQVDTQGNGYIFEEQWKR